MSIYKKKTYKVDANDIISIYINRKTFQPNLTTISLINSVKKIIKKNQKLLDLGCGSGVIGCYFLKKKLTNKFYGSDISNDAIKCSKYNLQKIKKNYDLRQSNLLNNWKSEKFDIIINDISGISSKLNNLTDWFKFAPNNSGKDGIKYTINVLKKYKKHLNKNGSLIFPVLGLSNRKKIVFYLKKEKINYVILYKKTWPLPSMLKKHQKILYKLKKQNIINYEEKFGLMYTSTEIFYCK